MKNAKISSKIIHFIKFGSFRSGTKYFGIAERTTVLSVQIRSHHHIVKLGKGTGRVLVLDHIPLVIGVQRFDSRADLGAVV